MFAFPYRAAALARIAALAGCAGGATVPSAGTPAAPAIHLAPNAAKITTSPKALNFTTTPSLKLTVSESKYTGTFSVTISPPGIAKVSPAKPKGPKAKVTVTAVAAGKATITIKDKTGNSASVSVTVTQGVIIIQ